MEGFIGVIDLFADFDGDFDETKLVEFGFEIFDKVVEEWELER